LFDRLVQAIAEIGAMLLGLVIGSVTALLHHVEDAEFRELDGKPAEQKRAA
jgi:hypothetical protein